MTEFELEMVAVVKELLSEFGFSGSLFGPNSGVLNRTTLEITEGTAFTPITAAFFDPTTSSLSGYERSLGTDYLKSKKWMIVESSVPVVTGSRIKCVHGTYTVHQATNVGPSNPIYYRVATDQTS
jgi:hypothetical protein